MHRSSARTLYMQVNKQRKSARRCVSFLLLRVESFLQVRKLDIAKQRVVECLQRCEDLNDLHDCRQGVQEAMAEEDYQVAARHIQRFLQLDAALFRYTDEEDKGSLECAPFCMNI